MADLQQLLAKTSRTFALAIPLLPEPTCTDVTLAYLIFRIADTLEDADNLEPCDRASALKAFETLLSCPDQARTSAFTTEWAARTATNNIWYQELLQNTPLVLDELSRRDAQIQRLVRCHAGRTASGMATFLEVSPTGLGSLEELARYCYFVAGIVGELLAEMFAYRLAGFTVTHDVRNSVHAFGEGLQLVNILKDSDDDAHCGRRFLPVDVERSTVFQLARTNLDAAGLFIERLRGADAPEGYVAFAELPRQLAWATLDCVERHGPGAKVTHDQVARILASLPAPARQNPETS